MADIRIKDLATTAASTASDDFVAVDGSANGTRKLNAYSPTFGGNLTVSGTGVTTLGATGARVLVNGATDDTSTNLQVSGNASLGTISLQAGPTTYAAYKMSFTAQAADEAFLVKFGTYKVLTGEGFDTPEVTKLYSNNTLALTLSSTQAATLAGNLTVSGSGVSSVTGGLKVQSLESIGTPASYNSTGGVILAGYAGTSYAFLKAYSDASGTEKPLVIQPSSGNALLGTTTDSGNGKLQLASHTTSAGGIGFGTDTSLYRISAGRVVIDHLGGSLPLLALRENGSSTLEIYTTSGVGVINTKTAKDLQFNTNNTLALTLDSSQRCILAGALRLNNAYVSGAPTATGYVTLQDSAGNTYKVLVGT